MGRKNFAKLGLSSLALFLTVLPSFAFAQRAGRSATDAAVIETILEDQDALNSLTAKHTRQIEDLERRIEDLEKRLSESKASVEEATKIKEELASLRAEVEALKEEQMPSKKAEGGKKRVWFEPIFQLRIRPEYQDNKGDTNSGRTDDDIFYSQRLRFGGVLRPSSAIRALVVAQDSRLWGEEASTLSDEKHLDLHEGYVEISDILVEGLGFRAGRMELAFGAERQVGAVDWSNVGRSFDGVRLFYHRPKLVQIDAFGTIVSDKGRSGGANTDFFGLYGRSDYLDFMDIEVYGLFLYNDVTKGTEKIGTLGARLVARPFEGLTLEGEAALQFGRSIGAGQVKEGTVKHLATAYFAQALYQFQVSLAPTLGLFLYSASGDANPYDSRNIAYRVLFPTGHAMLGFMDLFGWTGNLDVGPTLRLSPFSDLFVRLDYHLFYMTSEGGYMENAFGGTLFVPWRNGRFLGQEFDLLVRWRALEQLVLETGYSFFIPGEATKKATLERSGNRVEMGPDMAHWFYIQGTLSL